MSRWMGFIRLGLRRLLLLSTFGFVLNSCGPKAFHDQQDFSNGTSGSIPGTEAKITNAIRSTQESFVSNNTVAIVSNFNEKKLEFFGFCSGVRLNPYLIVTAAHCINDVEKMRILNGTNLHQSIRSPEFIFEIAEVKIHPKYKNSEITAERRFYDIALIKLKNPLPSVNNEYNLMQQFEMTLTTSQHLNHKNATDFTATPSLFPLITGFGVSFHKNTMSGPARTIGALSEATVNLRADDYSQKIITLKSESLSQACLGDSGGPLYIWREDRYYVQAIAISIKENESKDPFAAKTLCEKESSYLNLDHFKTWISENSRQL